ncbi:riboflavin biosynthesis protein RibF [Carnobacteriaceae bacterium zg-ZUI252]|nr:riboflavin biosynthesis protein RibF [Carnobacteriaceae bacterium zg-ZUI252]
MKVIEIGYPYVKETIDSRACVLALGFFDGIHLGHQKVIETAKKIALEKKLALAVMSFNQHPSVVFKKSDDVSYLTLRQEKEALLSRLGVDIFYIVEFTSEFSKLTPEQFEALYIRGLNAKTVVSGFDYRYGHKASGSLNDFATRQEDIDVVVVEKEDLAGEKISSTRIRHALSTGQIELANQLLGRCYTMSGVVVHGDARGRTIGYPTANVKVDAKQMLLAIGVYVVRLYVGGKWYNGMASIGRNITFEANRPITVEVNIFDFNQDIYGERVKVEWLHYLRGELKFDGIDGLMDQLHQDKEDTLEYLKH